MMLSFRVLFLFASLVLFVTSSLANQNNSRQNNTYTHEISDEKSGIRYTIETDSPSPPVLPEKAPEFVPNSWIVRFKQPGLMQYRLQQKARLQSKSAQHAEQQLKSLVLDQANVIKSKQQTFIARARSERWIDSASMRLTEISNAVVVSATETQIAQLRYHPDVAAVAQERLYQPTLHQSVSIINADDVWQRQDSTENAITGAGVKVAILDTGIDYNHPALGGCFGEGCKVAGGYDVYHDDPDPMDDDSSGFYIGHGTHVAGIVAANSEPLKGVAPDATLYAYKVCAPYCPESDILRGLELAANPDEDATTDDAVDVINLSLGSEYGQPDDPIPTAINQLVEQGIVVTVAAGNDGGFAKLGDIASAEKAITVASSYRDSKISNFSSGGPAKTDAFFKPDISAPGESILSACETTGDDLSHTCYKSGTSMAAPHIAGAAALLLQAYPQSSPQEIKSRLINTAKAFNDTSTIYQGAGLVDVMAALDTSATVNPAVGYFGNVGVAEQIWEKEISVELSNSEDTEQQYSLSIESDSPAGISWDLLSESSVVLAAGQTTDVIVKVTVNRMEFDIYLYEDMDIVANLSMQDGTQSINIPLIVTKMMAFELDYSSDYPQSVTLFNTEFGQYHYGGYVQDSFYMPIGNYNLVYHTETLEGVFVIFNEELSPETLLAGHQIDFSKATNKLSIDSVLSPDGSPVDLLNYDTQNFIEYTHTDARYHGFFSSSSFSEGANVLVNLNQKPLFVSDVSENFTFRLSFIWTPQQVPTESELDFFTFTDKWIGFNQDRQIEIDINDMDKFSFNYGANSFLEKGTAFLLYTHAKERGLSSSSFGFYSGLGLPIPRARSSERQVFNTPTRINVYGNVREDYDAHSLGIYDFDAIIPTSTERDTVLNEFSFQQEKGIHLWSYHSSENGSENSASFNVEPVFKFELNEKIVYDGEKKSIAPYMFSSVNQTNSGLLGEYFGAGLGRRNIFMSLSLENNKNIENRVYCDGDLIAEDFGRIVYTAFDCQKYKASFSIPNKLVDAESLSRLEIEFTSVIEGYPDVTNIEHYFITVDDELVSIPDKKSSKIHLLTSNNPAPENVSIEIKTDLGWQILDVITNNYNGQSLIHSADLPVPEKGLVAHFRFTLAGPLGDKTTYTLAGATFIGKEQSTIYVDDFDQDGLPDYKDMDDDNDEVDDLHDDLPFDASETIDTDGDGIGNNADTDDDNDSIEDSLDAFPLDPSESVDTDSDGIGNNADSDDDNDGVEDELDVFPLDPTESVDTDNDGIGNNADSDDDNDGVEDEMDAFPLDATESLDTDGDGIGNNADTDDDNDGVSDANDAFPLDSSRSAQPSPQTDSSSSSGGGGSLGQFILMLLCLAAFRRASNRAIRNL